MSELLSLPLFPLHAVLFPGGPLPLRIFEPRYLDMISDCLRNNHHFGICLIREGEEVGDAAITYDIGTVARIIDWDRRPDGLLGIDVIGEQRFRILSRKVKANQLIQAEVQLLAEEEPQPLPKEYLALADLLEQFISQLDELYEHIALHYDDASWTSNRLAELLPMAFAQRQYLLELNSPLQRLEVIGQLLKMLKIQY